MFVRNNVFVSLKSLMSMSSVRQEAEVIDEEIMRLSKSQVSNAPVLLFADYNAANGREKKNPRENVSMKDARNDCGKVLCDDSK